MAERIVRHNLSGGRLGAELGARSDLEHYHKANREQMNFVATPYGGVERRKPLAAVGTIPSITVEGVAYYPEEARGFPFVYDAATKYDAVLVSYAAEGQEDINRFVIYNHADGAQKDYVDVPYLRAEFFAIDFHQVNDVMFLVHQNHAPAKLVRYADGDWRMETHRIVGGPFLEQNRDQDIKVNIGLSVWRNDVNYQNGDIVLPVTAVSGTASWIGTAYSFAKNAALVADLAVAAEWVTSYETSLGTAYYIDNLDFCSKASAIKKDGNFSIRVWYPYTIFRVDKTFAAELEAGDSVSFLTDFVEDGGDDGYAKQGIVAEIMVGTAYGYLKVDLGWILSFFPGYTSAFSINRTHFYSDYYGGGVPHPDIPEAEKGYWSALFNYSSFHTEALLRSSHIAVGSNDNGGAFLTATAGNIKKGEGAAVAYVALVPNTNIETSDADVWGEIANPTSSNLVLADALGIELFASGDVGRLFYADPADRYAMAGIFNAAAQVSDAVFALGRVRLVTEGGTWSGEIVLETSNNGGADWAVAGNINSANLSHNGSVERNISMRGTQVRVRMAGYTAGGTGCYWRLELPSGYSTIYQVVVYLTPGQAICRAVTGSENFFQTSIFALGAFGGSQGYPGAVCIHEERMLFGGTVGRPFSIFGSAVNDWENFADGTLETSPVVFRAQSDNVTRIAWMLSRDKLFFGTDFGEYTAGSRESDTVLSGENPPSVKRHTPHGSAPIKALAVHDQVVFVLPDFKGVRCLKEAEYTTSFKADDLTIFSPDIAGATGFRTMCLQRTPYPVLWFVRNDGQLASFTYEPGNDIMGWARHATSGGLVKSAWTVPDAQSVDEVVCVVERSGLALSASGTGVPDVTGTWDYMDTLRYVTLSGGTEADGEFVFSAGSEPGDIGSWFNPENQDNMRRLSGVWRITKDGDPSVLLFTNPAQTDDPPTTGWVAVGGAAGIPAVSAPWSETLYSLGTDDQYTLGRYAGRYVIAAGSTPLFECATLVGIYLPAAGSGAEGSVNVGPLNYHIEKLSNSATEYVDNLGGPAEVAMQSLIEPTSLIQGQGVLEGRKVRVVKVLLYLVASQGGEVSVDGGATWTPIEYPDANLFTGMREVRVNSGNIEQFRLQIRTRGDQAFQLGGLAVDVAGQERS